MSESQRTIVISRTVGFKSRDCRKKIFNVTFGPRMGEMVRKYCVIFGRVVSGVIVSGVYVTAYQL